MHASPQDITEGSPNRVDGLQRVAWEARRPLVFFRGSYRPDSISLHQLGARTRAARVGLQHPAILDVKLYMHCKAGTPACSDPPPGDLEDALFGQYLSLDQQLAYKYQLDIDGYAGSFRLKHLMLSGSLVFKVDSPFTQHWMLALVPWVSSVFLQQLRRCRCAPPATQHSLNCNFAGSLCARLMAQPRAGPAAKGAVGAGQRRTGQADHAQRPGVCDGRVQGRQHGLVHAAGGAVSQWRSVEPLVVPWRW